MTNKKLSEEEKAIREAEKKIKKADYNKQYYQAHKEESKQYCQDHKEERREKSKQWYQDHKEEKAEKNKQWYQDHKEDKKQYYHDNKEKIAERFKQYNQTHKEEIAKKNKQWYQDHKEERCEKMKQHYQTPEGRAEGLAKAYNRSDKEKGFDISNNIKSNYIVSRIFKSKCIYCGNTDWKALGADRINNDLPHTPDNVVCACWGCNVERESKHMSVEEFIEYRKEHPLLSRDYTRAEKNEHGALKKKVHVPMSENNNYIYKNLI